jgi:hypothetical protein
MKIKGQDQLLYYLAGMPPLLTAETSPYLSLDTPSSSMLPDFYQDSKTPLVPCQAKTANTNTNLPEHGRPGSMRRLASLSFCLP